MSESVKSHKCGTLGSSSPKEYMEYERDAPKRMWGALASTEGLLRRKEKKKK
jgi:hypothetical protein